MSERNQLRKDADLFKTENFDIGGLSDELRAVDLVDRLLRLFYLDLVEDETLSPEEASALAYSADYFLKDFLIDDRHDNIFRLRPGRVRQFAGNWYIIRNLEPNIEELRGLLEGVAAFYRWCRRVGKVNEEAALSAVQECADLDYYRQRIENFWAIEKDGYLAWEKECSLRD